MNDLAVRLQDALDIRGLKPAELSEKTGIDKGAISRYLSNKYKPKYNAIVKLATALDVQPAWLMGYDVPMENERKGAFSSMQLDINEVEIIKKYRSLDTHGSQMVSYVLDSEYRRVQQVIAASKGETVQNSVTIAVPLLQNALSDKVVSTVPVMATEEITNSEDDLFALTVTRDSMAPRIAPGDTIIVKRQDDVNSGDIAVVVIGSDVICKQVIKRGDEIVLVPFNRNHETKIFNREEMIKRKIRIMGKVIENYQAM